MDIIDLDDPANIWQIINSPHTQKILKLSFQDLYGRGRRLRTLGLRFWRPPLYQLSYSPMLTWWTVRDSNPGPTGYEPVALPTELTVRNSLKKYCRHDIVTAIPLFWRPL